MAHLAHIETSSVVFGRRAKLASTEPLSHRLAVRTWIGASAALWLGLAALTTTLVRLI